MTIEVSPEFAHFIVTIGGTALGCILGFLLARVLGLMRFSK